MSTSSRSANHAGLEMSYFGSTILPLRSMDARGSVLSLGTFSKVLFPGLRIGWIAVERGRIERLREIRGLSDDCGNTMIQAALNELCVSGSYQKHLELVNRIYTRRMRAALDALSRHVPPEKATWTRPRGGYLIWLTLAPTDMSEAELHSRLCAHGVDAEAGSAFFAKAHPRLHLRLSISAHPEDVLEEGIRRLGEALKLPTGARVQGDAGAFQEASLQRIPGRQDRRDTDFQDLRRPGKADEQGGGDRG